MNVIEKTREILNSYENIQEFAENVNIDFTSSEESSVGLSSSGDVVLAEDILGNQSRRHTFTMYASNQAINNFDRLKNSNFLLELGYYLSTIKNVQIENGVITGITASNQMLLSIPTGNINDLVLYQIQINVNYTRNK